MPHHWASPSIISLVSIIKRSLKLWMNIAIETAALDIMSSDVLLLSFVDAWLNSSSPQFASMQIAYLYALYCIAPTPILHHSNAHTNCFKANRKQTCCLLWVQRVTSIGCRFQSHQLTDKLTNILNEWIIYITFINVSSALSDVCLGRIFSTPRIGQQFYLLQCNPMQCQMNIQAAHYTCFRYVLIDRIFKYCLSVCLCNTTTFQLEWKVARGHWMCTDRFLDFWRDSAMRVSVMWLLSHRKLSAIQYNYTAYRHKFFTFYGPIYCCWSFFSLLSEAL